MDPAHTPDHHAPHHQPQPPHAPTPPAVATASGAGWLNRTSSAFVAEYCMFIISLGIAVASLTWMVYLFFAMVVAATNGINFGGSAIKLLILWLIIASLVSLPAAAILWSRTRGELLANEHFKGVLPGGARGFRTFWIVVAVLGMIGMLIFAIYAPLATLINGGIGAGQVLLGVTLPGLINLGLSASAIYIMTRPADRPGPSRIMLWAITGLSVLLFIVTFVWASNAPDPYSPYRSSPSRYNDSYYDYSY